MAFVTIWATGRQVAEVIYRCIAGSTSPAVATSPSDSVGGSHSAADGPSTSGHFSGSHHVEN